MGQYSPYQAIAKTVPLIVHAVILVIAAANLSTYFHLFNHQYFCHEKKLDRSFIFVTPTDLLIEYNVCINVACMGYGRPQTL